MSDSKSSHSSRSSSLGPERKKRKRDKSALSSVDTADVETLLKISLHSLARTKTQLKDMISIGDDFPACFLDDCYDRLVDCISSHDFFGEQVNEDTRSLAIHSQLEVVHRFIRKKYKGLIFDHVEIVLKEQLKWVETKDLLKGRKFDGFVDFSVVRYGKKAGSKSYYLVVECKKDSAVNGLKQCCLYLKRLYELAEKKQVKAFILLI